MRLTLTHMLSFEANASPFSGLALDRLPTCSCVHVVAVPAGFEHPFELPSNRVRTA